jgi:hypothetical protein
MVDKYPIARPHLANILDGLRISHAIPRRLVIALEIVDGVSARFGFGEMIFHVS